MAKKRSPFKDKRTKQERESERYNKLREAGYSSKEASNLKGQSDENVKKRVKEKRDEIRKETRRENYHIARGKGLSSKEASRIASLGKEKIEVFKATEITEKNKKQVLEMIREIGVFKIPRLKTVDDAGKVYREPYSYIIKYTKENGEIDYITITSLEPMSEQDLWKASQKVLEDGNLKSLRKYSEVKILNKSIKVDEAIFNPYAGNEEKIKEMKAKKLKKNLIKNISKKLKK